MHSIVSLPVGSSRPAIAIVPLGPARLRAVRPAFFQRSHHSRPSAAATGAQTASGDGPSPQKTQHLLDSVVETGRYITTFLPAWPGGQEWKEEVLQEAERQEDEVQQRSGPADITTFLQPVSLAEACQIRKLSNLCGLSYKPHLVTPRGIWLRHRLELVTTSWSFRASSVSPRSAADTAAQGDGMAVGLKDAHTVYIDPVESVEGDEAPCVDGDASGEGPASPLAAVVMQPATVASKIAEAAAAAAAAAASLAGVTVSKLVGGGGANGNSDPAIGAADTVTTVTSLSIDDSDGGGGAAGTKGVTAVVNVASAITTDPQKPAAAAAAAVASATVPGAAPATAASVAATSPAVGTALITSGPLCPSEWFVCDDPAAQLRVFVIQGSDSIDHWRLNLTLDPVTFEDPALGVTVHRGVYEAAKVLYDRFLPLVYEHLDTSPFAQVAFTGHSIGGCLAMLLTIMYRQRGVLHSNNISPCYMFGSPSVFCGGGSAACELPSNGVDQGPPAEAPSAACGCATGGASRLLASIGLDDSKIRNVMMHRDVVPRAFTCDYPDILSRILKGWGPAFKSHCCLEGDGHKHLYSFIGTLLILQPAREHAFIMGDDADHPLLPPGPGFYYVREPPEGAKAKSSRSKSNGTHRNGSGSNSSSDSSSNGTGTAPGHSLVPLANQGTADVSPDTYNSDGGVDVGLAVEQGGAKVPASTNEAVLTIMDNPHPLKMLSDPAAYTEKGQVCRFHHPDHMTQALGKLIYLSAQQMAQPL